MGGVGLGGEREILYPCVRFSLMLAEIFFSITAILICGVFMFPLSGFILMFIFFCSKIFREAQGDKHTRQKKWLHTSSLHQKHGFCLADFL